RRRAVLVLGVALVTALGWALLPVDVAGANLQREAIVLLALVFLAALYTILPDGVAGAAWSAAARGLAPWLSLAALPLLAHFAVSELIAYRPDALATPLLPVLVWLLVPGIVLLLALCIHQALTREADMFGLAPERRTVYVYLAELVFV